jgi:radical SAM enzyme (rSAM/lipoprotein system)
MVASEHPLRQLFWECTLRCNLHCRHCGSDCKVQAEQQDMPLDDFLHVLDSIAAKTNPSEVFVILSGGEPLMRHDIVACGQAITDRGFPWGMVSNGFALTQERFYELLKAGMRSITISLDGLEEEHNWMRGHRQSFERVDQAISLLTAVPDLASDIVTCVNRRNYSHLPALKEYLIGKDVKNWRLFTVFPVGRAATDPDMRLTDEEFRGVFDFIRQTRQEGRIHANYGCEGFVGNYEGDVRDHLYSCQAGITIGSVLADGSISACTSIRSNYHQGNIYHDDFMDVWEQRFQAYRNHDWMRTDDCARCRYFRYCQGNGMHLRDNEGHLLLCHIKRLQP